jgi:putative transposase
MSTQQFKTGQYFVWKGQGYEVRRLLAGNKLGLANLQSMESQEVPFMELYQALLAGELRFVLEPGSEGVMPEGHGLELADYPETLLAVARYRFEIIRPFLILPPQQRKKAIEARVKELQVQREGANDTLQTAISVVSVYRWLRGYRRSGGDLRALIPHTSKRGGKQQTRLPSEVEAIIQNTIDDLYYVREQRSIDYVHREVAVRVAEENLHHPPEERFKVPSRSTLDRRLTALDLEGKLIAKRGWRQAQRDLTQYLETDYPTIPLGRVEIDHSRTNVIVIDQNDYLPLGRLTLTYGLDTTSRYPVGYNLGFEPPSYLSVMECLYHAILPKANLIERYGTQHEWLAYGVPFTLVVDNGQEFIGRDLDDACQLLGIVLERMPIRTPYFKAAVERMFGTTDTGLFFTLPGTTFANPGQRGDYDSLKQACLSQNDLDQILNIFMVDIYAEDFHRGLNGIPARRWEAATQNGFFPRVPASAQELRILLGRVAYRTIQPYGIELHSLRYNCSELTSLRTRMWRRADKRIKIKYNPADLGCIQVYDPDEQQYLAVPALAQDYAQGLSLWKHRVIRNFVLTEQRTVDMVALGQAQRKIQTIVEQSMHRKKLSTRTKIARWQSQPVEPKLAEPVKIDASTLPTFDLALDPAELEREGWGLSYAQAGATSIKSGESHD